MSATPISVPVSVIWTVRSTGQSAEATPATPLQVSVAQVHIGLKGAQGLQGLQGLQGFKGDKGDKGDIGDVTPAAEAARNAAQTARDDALTHAGTAGMQAGVATTKAGEAAASAAAAVLARDASLVGAGLPYVDEPTGRAAVADGVAFKVQGSGDVAVYEYRRVDAGSSTLVATYPSEASVKKRLEGAQSRNLFNPGDAAVALGFFPSSATGALQANVSYNATGFIPVTEGLSYTFSQKHYVCWYTAAKVFISGTSDADTNKTKVAPAGAAFVRASASAAVSWSIFQVELGTERTDYTPYGTLFDSARVVDSSIPGKKLSAISVTPDKTSFLKIGKNLFNKLAATIGYFLGNNGEPPAANATFDYSAFIPVVPGQVLKSSHNMRFTTFYSAGQFFKTGGSNVDTTSITVPADVYFIRVTIYHANINTFQLEFGDVSTAYEGYGYVVSGPNNEPLLPPAPKENSVSTASLQDAAVTPAKSSFLQLGKNLFDKSVAVLGFLGPAGGAITASADYYVSDFIAVTAGLPYYGFGGTGMRFTTYYNASKVVVAGGSSATVSTFTPPAGVAFVRISISASNLHTFQFEQGAAPTAFKPFGYVLRLPSGAAIYLDTVAEDASWGDKTWASLGDSITAGGTWQPKVAGTLGLTWSNYGVGGTAIAGAPGSTAAMCQDARIDAIPADRDLVTVMGGTNDWAQNIPLGAADSIDPLTFNGALNTLAQKLCARFPAKRIVLMTTPYGELPGRVADGTNNWVNAWTNNLGLTTRDYAEAVRGACKRWGLPCADIAQDCGWNTTNITTYITNDGGLLHPNAVGGGRISQVLLGTLKAISPV